MSVKLMSTVFELPVRATQKLVLLAMADHARDDGTGCYPSLSRLARKTSLTKRGVRKTLRQLESDGLIRAGGTTRYGTIEYTLNVRGEEQRSLPPGERGDGKGRNVKTQREEPWSPESLGTQNRNHTPLPPAHAGASTQSFAPNGNEHFFTWARETVAVQMGRRKRIPSLESYQGARASEVVGFLIRRGFSARIVEEKQE
jgi:hypothetical protein